MTKVYDPNDLQSRTVEWLRYPLMVLVVIIHTDTSLLYSMPHEGLSSVLFYILRTVIRVAVPMFFIFSGYWFFRKPDTFTFDAYRTKIRKRVRTLLIPYLFWNFFAWALQLAVVVMQGHADWIPSDVFHPKKLIDVFIGYGEGYQGMPKAYQLWFLRDLMIVCLLSPLLHMLLRGKRPWVLLVFAAIYLMPWPSGWHSILKRMPAALLFFGIGACMGIHKINMVEAVRRVPLWLSISVPTLAMVWHVLLLLHGSPAFIYAENIFSIVAVIPTMQVAAFLVERKNAKPIKWLSGSAFLLFVTHPLINHYLLVEPIGTSLAPTLPHFWLVLAAEVALPVAVCAITHIVMSHLLPRTYSLLIGGR